ncbi:MAG: SDR family oxidoreductase [Planctomycetes bacterium]|nr:SDR family oxidoreductase [Planctomycetota bacterium]
MTQCLVTGGAGFIGSHLVEHLLAAGHQVRVLDDFTTGKRENLAAVQDRVEVRAGSITDPDAVRAAVREVQWIFHLAALPSVQRSIEEPLTSHAACATGTLQVLDAARQAGVHRVVYAASSSAYGDIPGTTRTEDDPLSPMSPYAAAKLAGEHYCRCFTTSYGLETVRLRFFNIFGPRQDARSPYSGVIALFLAAMAAGKSPTIYGDGQQSRDFTYVDNAVQAVVKAAAAPAAVGQVYNVGVGSSTSVLDLVRTLNELLGRHIQPQHGPARLGDVRYSQADISRARRDLGYEPTVSFKEGLRRTLAAYLSSQGQAGERGV